MHCSSVMIVTLYGINVNIGEQSASSLLSSVRVVIQRLSSSPDHANRYEPIPRSIIPDRRILIEAS